MVNSFPNKIRFKADDNEAILSKIETTKNSKVKVGYYQYTKSRTKLGISMPMELDYINRLLNFDLLEILER